MFDLPVYCGTSRVANCRSRFQRTNFFLPKTRNRIEGRASSAYYMPDGMCRSIVHFQDALHATNIIPYMCSRSGNKRWNNSWSWHWFHVDLSQFRTQTFGPFPNNDWDTCKFKVRLRSVTLKAPKDRYLKPDSRGSFWAKCMRWYFRIREQFQSLSVVRVLVTIDELLPLSTITVVKPEKNIFKCRALRNKTQ